MPMRPTILGGTLLWWANRRFKNADTLELGMSVGMGRLAVEPLATRQVPYLELVQSQVEKLVLQSTHEDDTKASQVHLGVHVLPSHKLPYPLKPQVDLYRNL